MEYKIFEINNKILNANKINISISLPLNNSKQRNNVKKDATVKVKLVLIFSINKVM
jgi:hypothetical protein